MGTTQGIAADRSLPHLGCAGSGKVCHVYFQCTPTRKLKMLGKCVSLLLGKVTVPCARSLARSALTQVDRHRPPANGSFVHLPCPPAHSCSARPLPLEGRVDSQESGPTVCHFPLASSELRKAGPKRLTGMLWALLQAAANQGFDSHFQS